MDFFLDVCCGASAPLSQALAGHTLPAYAWTCLVTIHWIFHVTTHMTSCSDLLFLCPRFPALQGLLQAEASAGWAAGHSQPRTLGWAPGQHTPTAGACALESATALQVYLHSSRCSQQGVMCPWSNPLTLCLGWTALCSHFFPRSRPRLLSFRLAQWAKIWPSRGVCHQLSRSSIAGSQVHSWQHACPGGWDTGCAGPLFVSAYRRIPSKAGKQILLASGPTFQ